MVIECHGPAAATRTSGWTYILLIAGLPYLAQDLANTDDSDVLDRDFIAKALARPIWSESRLSNRKGRIVRDAYLQVMGGTTMYDLTLRDSAYSMVEMLV